MLIGRRFRGSGDPCQAAKRWAEDPDPEIEPEGVSNQFRCRKVEASSPGKDKRGRGAANGVGLRRDRRRLLLALEIEALLHELDIFGDGLVELVQLLAAQDVAFLIVRRDTKRWDRHFIEIALKTLLHDPAVCSPRGLGRFASEQLVIKLLLRLKHGLVAEQNAEEFETGYMLAHHHNGQCQWYCQDKADRAPQQGPERGSKYHRERQQTGFRPQQKRFEPLSNPRISQHV